jgi:hypothetical protein
MSTMPIERELAPLAADLPSGDAQALRTLNAPGSFSARILSARFSSIDLLMVTLWSAMMLMALFVPGMRFLQLSLLSGGVLVGRHIWSVVYRGETRDGNLELAVLLPVFGVFSTAAFTFVTRATPVTYDSLLAKWDMGFAPMVRTWALAHPMAMDPAVWVYRCLPISILLVLCTTTGRTRSRLVWSLYLGAFLSLVWYLIFPAVGPIHVGDPSAPRNCMPSMHLTWTLLLFVNSKGWVKWAAGIFAALTAFATLATGEHYYPDLIAALPWAWVITLMARKWAK